MSFDTLDAVMAAQVIALLGESVTYTADGEDAATVNAVVDHDVEVFDPYESGVNEKRIEAVFVKTDVPNIALGDAITIDSTNYVLQEKIEDDGITTRWSMRLA